MNVIASLSVLVQQAVCTHSACVLVLGYKPRNPLDLLPGILAELKVHPTLKERLDSFLQLQQEVEETINVGTRASSDITATIATPTKRLKVFNLSKLAA